MELNRCNAYRLAGKQQQSVEFLNKIDTSALGSEFKLAEAVIREEYDLAADLMRQIGDKHKIVHPFAYSDWPLFEGFRDQAIFLSTYEEIFGEPFTIKTDLDANDEKSTAGKKSSRKPKTTARKRSPAKRKRTTTTGTSSVH